MGKFYNQMAARYDMAAFSWAADHATRPGTLAAFMDTLIKNEDAIEQIVKKTEAEARKRRHQMMYTEGIIHKHIKYRIRQAKGNKN